jgi:hypothetical protein
MSALRHKLVDGKLEPLTEADIAQLELDRNDQTLRWQEPQPPPAPAELLALTATATPAELRALVERTDTKALLVAVLQALRGYADANR